MGITSHKLMGYFLLSLISWRSVCMADRGCQEPLHWWNWALTSLQEFLLPRETDMRWLFWGQFPVLMTLSARVSDSSMSECNCPPLTVAFSYVYFSSIVLMLEGDDMTAEVGTACFLRRNKTLGTSDCFGFCSLWAGESGASLEGRWAFQCLQLSGIILVWAFKHDTAVKWR